MVQPLTFANTNLVAVWGSAPDDVWITGDDGSILHRTTGQFVKVVSLSKSFRAMWGSSRNDLWFAGDDLTLAHFDGATLNIGSLGTTQRFLSIWGSSPTDIWATGAGGVVARNRGLGFSLVIDGPQSVSSKLVSLTGIWGSGSNDIWAVGLGADTIFHFDGLSWQIRDRLSEGFAGVWGSGISQVWAVGASGAIVNWKR